MFLLEALYSATAKLKRHMMLFMTTGIISEEAKVMSDVECAGMRVD